MISGPAKGSSGPRSPVRRRPSSLFGPAPQSYHVSISINPAQGFFAPGGTEVWQAEAAFEWLLATAFGP